MKPETGPALRTLNEECEGVVDWIYCDVKGLVTTGIGLLLEPECRAHRLVWLKPDGTSATPAEVTTAWNAVKVRQDLKLLGGGKYKNVSCLRATRESLEGMYDVKASEFEASMKKWFPKWEEWPWHAQVGALGMCWAMGGNFPMKYPHFTAACRVQDWVTASKECGISEVQNEPIHKRNVKIAQLFMDAAGG